MWFKMAALKVYTAVTVILVILMCGKTTVACPLTNCDICIGSECTRCLPGFFVTEGGTCQACKTSCGTGQYLKTPCGLSRDAECLPCSNATACVDGYYVSSPCTGTADRICTACKVCARGTYKTGGCVGTSNTVCVGCKTKCTGDQYITTPCNSTADARCNPCTTCPDGTFEVAPCDGINDRECAACTAECPEGYFVSANCTPTANLQCTACGCADYEFIEDQEDYCGPNTTENYDCERCQTCLPGLEYVANECGSYEDTDCKPCDPPCGKGQYESTPCNGVTNRKCTNCTKCGPGEVEKKPCRLKADRVCEKKRSPKATLLQNCKNKFAQRIRLGFRCQQVLCKNVPSYRRLYDCSRFLLTKRQPVFPSFG